MKAFLLRLGKPSSSKRFCVQPSTCAVLQKEQLGMFRKSRRRIQMDCPHPLPVPVLSVPPPASPSVHPSGRASLCFPRTSQPAGGPWGVPGEGGLSKALVWISRPPPRGGGAVQGAHLHQRWLHFQLSLTPHVPTLPSTLRPLPPQPSPEAQCPSLGLASFSQIMFCAVLASLPFLSLLAREPPRRLQGHKDRSGGLSLSLPPACHAPLCGLRALRPPSTSPRSCMAPHAAWP